MRGTTVRPGTTNAAAKALALLLALLAWAPAAGAATPHTEYRPYNVGLGAWAACPGDIVLASVGGACFLLEGGESSVTLTLLDATFASGVPAIWEFDTGATGAFCDTVDLSVPSGAASLRVWVGALSEITMVADSLGGSPVPPCVPGLASTGLVEAAFS